MDPKDLYRRASEYASGVVANVERSQFGDPTPCTDWNVGELLGHIIGGNRMFAATARGEAPPDGDPVGVDPSASYRDAAAAVAAAFAAPGAYERMMTTPAGEMPGAAFYTVAASEQLVHGWDLAKATGQDTSLDPELAAAIEAFLRPGVPDAAAGGFYGAEVTVGDDASPGDRLVALLGRQP